MRKTKLMTQKYYTLRIRVANADNVRLDILDPSNRLIGEPVGKAGFNDQTRSRILHLHERARSGDIPGEEMEELGGLLFSALFDRDLQREFLNYYDAARKENTFLRLELDVDERSMPEAAAFPWESMCVPKGGDNGALWLATAREKSPDYDTLAALLKRGELIPFLGPGVLRLSGFPTPSSQDMVKKMAERIECPDFNGTFPMISQYGQLETQSAAGKLWLQYPGQSREPGLFTPEEISGLKLFDDGYSIIYKIRGHFNLADYDTPNAHTMGKLDKASPMIFEEEFFTLSKHLEQMIPDHFIRKFSDSGFLFLGYNLDDWQDRLIAYVISKKWQNSKNSFSVCASPNPYERIFWKSLLSIDLYEVELPEFTEKLYERVR
jgi:hypothetical protein